jgi:lysophospholipase L1-like esterase
MLLAQGSRPPFRNDILAFKKQDSISMPARQQILFVGSSSFTNWKDVQDYFPNNKILNRGFGGSTLTDVVHYEKEIIFPYKPMQIVIYCGENDIAGADSVTGEIVFERFKNLYIDIKKNLPGVFVVYISMKPSPARWAMRDRMMRGNELIKRYLRKKKRYTDFINVWEAMLSPDGKPMEDIFLDDKLHMNAKGYAIWQKLIQPVLKK